MQCLDSIDNRFESCDELLNLLFPRNVQVVDGHNRFSKKHITNVTQKSIEKFLKKYISFSYNGDLPVINFLKRLYKLDSIESVLPYCKDIEDEIMEHEDINNRIEKSNENILWQLQDWDGYHSFDWDWIFSDVRFGLRNDDNRLLSFLCEMFHPEVRDWFDKITRNMCLQVIEGLNGFLIEDGYELYESSKISGRPVYSYRISMFTNLQT